MADDDLEDIDLDESEGVQDDVDYDDSTPVQPRPSDARRELEKRLEMKRLRELLDDSELDVEI